MCQMGRLIPVFRRATREVERFYDNQEPEWG
jgi:hypothetical protein